MAATVRQSQGLGTEVLLARGISIYRIVAQARKIVEEFLGVHLRTLPVRLTLSPVRSYDGKLVVAGVAQW
jgi:hypothetical protein